MTEIMSLARFVERASLAMMSEKALQQLKIRVLDTLGVAIGALDAPPIQQIRAIIDALDSTSSEASGATLIGGGHASPDHAAFYNSALSRYLDFMDAYLAKGETNHPSDNMGAVLAAAERAHATGEQFLTAFAVAYQIHARLSDVAPVRDLGFDHTTQGAFAAGAAAAKAMGLPAEQIANAASMAGTANVALRVTRTGDLSNWKGLAYAHVSKDAVFDALLASRGITGPAEVFEGNKGFKALAGDFDLDWSQEDLEKVAGTIIKKHNAEIHSQSALDAAQEIRAQEGFRVDAVSSIELTTFGVAYRIIGGGEEGDKRRVRTKEEADHSLPWMLAVTLLDGHLTPAQYEPDRIIADDVQDLMTKVTITESADFSARFPEHMCADLTVRLGDGTAFHASTDGYEGFTTNPPTWEQARAKFDTLATPFADAALREEIAGIVATLEDRPISDLTSALARVSATRG